MTPALRWVALGARWRDIVRLGPVLSVSTANSKPWFTTSFLPLEEGAGKRCSSECVNQRHYTCRSISGVHKCLKLLHRDFRRLQIFRDASHSMVMQQRLLSPAGQSICLVSCLPCHSLRHVQVKMYVTLIIAVELYVIAFICCCFSFAVGIGI